MTREEVKALLTELKTERPFLFEAEDSAEILERWCRDLAKYSKEEVYDLGFARIGYYHYTHERLEKQIAALEEERWYKTEEGKKSLQRDIDAWLERKKHVRRLQS